MVTSGTMGCGCSRTGSGSRPTSGRRVNPSESPGSTPERGYGLKPNGCLTNGLTTGHRVSRGVDTGSLRTSGRYSPLRLRRGQASAGVQCDLDDDHFRFEAAGTGSALSWASSRCSSLNRMSRRRPLAAASARLSLSTSNLPRVADQWSSRDSVARLTCVRLSTSGFLPPGSDGLPSPGSGVDASSQTDQWPEDDRHAVTPEFAPRPPASRKVQLLKNRDFAELDRMAREVPVSFTSSVRSLVGFLGLSARTDLELVRSFYVWIAHHIRYDIKHAEAETNAEVTLEQRSGVSKDYCQLFADMCRLSDVRSEVIRGFAKGFSHTAGHNFRPGLDGVHCWNAVFLGGSWRLVDCTWGTGIVNSLGRFQERFSERFFLSDPEEFSWTHFPYGPKGEESYSRWQLLEEPLTLERFNALPKVFPHFFEYGLKIRTPWASSPWSFAYSTELVLSSPRVLRYKHKLHPAAAPESRMLNQYVFCQMTQHRLWVSFAVGPPDDGDFVLKVYARPEADLGPSDSVLTCVATFALRCTRTRKVVTRYPPNDLPWGPTGHLAETGLRVVNASTPVLTVVAGRKCLLLEAERDVLVTHQLTDARGREVNPKGSVGRSEDQDARLLRFLVQPPEVGLYKLALFACPRPSDRGQWRLPCVATFLVDCKQTLAAGGEIREQIFAKKGSKKGN